MEQQIIATWVQIGINTVGLSGIFWGLFQMQKAGRRRDREIDMMSQSVKQQGEAFERQGVVLGQMLERQSQTLGQILERQSQTLDRHDRALEELLRRGA